MPINFEIVTTQARWQPLSLTPRFIAVQAEPPHFPNRFNGLLAERGQRLKPFGATGWLDFTAMNRGVNENLDSPCG